MYNLIYVDEEKSARNEFMRELHTDFDITPVEPIHDIDEFIDFILKSNCDGVVTDFRLNEHSTVGYTGTELVDRLLEVREDFPVFVLTGFPNGDGDVAIAHVPDANIVYDKNDLKEERKKSLFRDKININIRLHKERISKAERRIEELIAKGELTAKEESELVYLDSFLEKSIDKQSSIPESVKQQFLEHKFDELISLGKKILEKNS